jgi:hypothetical protein
MTISNKYLKRSKISEAKFREFIRYFSLALDAHKISFLTGLNRNTVNRYVLLTRKRIAEFCEQSPLFSENSKETNHTSEPTSSVPARTCTVKIPAAHAPCRPCKTHPGYYTSDWPSQGFPSGKAFRRHPLC